MGMKQWPLALRIAAAEVLVLLGGERSWLGGEIVPRVCGLRLVFVPVRRGRRQTLLRQQLCGRDQLPVRMREEVGHSA